MAMNRNTVVQLKSMAKERGLNGYSRLRKDDLIQFINDARPIPAPRTIRPIPAPRTLVKPIPAPRTLVKPIPAPRINRIVEAINSYVKPTLIGIKKAFDWVPKQALNLNSYITKNLNDLIGWAKRPSQRKQLYELKESKSALRKFTMQYVIEGRAGYDPESFMADVKRSVINFLRNNRRTKIKLIMRCNMEKNNFSTGEVITHKTSFHSKPEVNIEGTDVDDLYNTMVDRVLEAMATFQRDGSNWTFKSIICLEIHTVAYEPLKGNSYIPLPPKLAQKKAIINMQNEDNKCFTWSVLRALNPRERDNERIDKDLKKKEDSLNMTGIVNPVQLNAIDKFERQNPTISINVFGHEESVCPLRVSKCEGREVVNLLLISDDEKRHYCLIKSMSRLLSTQTSKRNGAQYYCMRCLNPFHSQESLDKHLEYCSAHEAVKIEMPGEGTTLSFKNYNRSMRVPFIVYADFESFIKPIDTCGPNPENSYTKQYQKHTPSSFCYYIKCFDDEVYYQNPVTYTASTDNEDVAQIFVNMLEEDVKSIYNRFSTPKEMIFGVKEREEFDEATECWICHGELGLDRVRDHCHLTGKYRGGAHNKCNLQYRRPKFIPVVFHNLSGYDSHLFIKNLGVTEGNINCIPNNEEKYISFSKDIVVGEYTSKNGKIVDIKQQLRFIDSFKFVASSLDKLVENLDKHCCVNTGKFYKGKQLSLLMRKGVYPYEYASSCARFDDKQLPPKEAFYSKLSGEGISDDDYKHAHAVWDEFGMKTFKDYHNLYNKSDVLLLADVFENFRDVCMKNYQLDPAWYYTAPGLAWDAALKKTGVELELLSDPDMLLMFEKGIRGGISMISNRHGKANNSYMDDEYDDKRATKYITYLDANNLYGWAMCKPLPTSNFKWMDDDELTSWKKHTCILEVDLEYSKHLHDLHNDYPLAPERLVLGKVEKLVPNLNDKIKYVIHYENLKLYESLGLKITKIHRGIKFEESPWLKKYIDLNTDLRSKANNEFEKDFVKLMNNSVFGKTMENIRNRVDIRLVNSEKKAMKLAAKPNFKHCNIFDENLVAIHMKKTKLVFNKPVYLGMCILDLSKTLMYDFHYNYIKNKFNDKATLLFTDTDSLAYEIETEDFYKDISGDVHGFFDTSNFPKGHSSGIEVGCNKKVVGMFKDEAGGKIISEFVGLRPKLYAYKMHDGKEEKRCKGVKKAVVKRSINFEDYKTCLFTGKPQTRTMNVIRSHRHELFTEEINKIALSANDDKRVILEDGIHTLAHGHWRI